MSSTNNIGYLTALVTDRISRALGHDIPNMDSTDPLSMTIKDTGIDSLELMELALWLEDELAIDDIDDSYLGEWKTIGDIVNYLVKEVAN